MSTHQHPYPPSAESTSVAKIERAQLCDLLEQVGPHAPTLSGRWDTHHLAAHLVVREGTPLGVIKVMRPKVGGEEVDRLVQERDFGALVDEIRSGPPRLSVFGTGLTDRAGNGLEYFIHHEDVRRAMPGFDRRQLPMWALNQLWGSLGLPLKAVMRKAPVGVALRRTDTGELRVVANKPRTVVVAGAVPELALFALGRAAVAEVELDGDAADVAVLQATSFTL